ncbi:MAG: S8 family serine peptidase [Desulfomonile sp.]|nr:S8 family serine peptidase [Desulfomonile sp.]
MRTAWTIRIALTTISALLVLTFSVLASAQSPVGRDRPPVGRGGAVEQNRDPATNVGISLTVDKHNAQPGDAISISAEVDRDCYLTIVTFGESGQVVRLWPNSSSGWDPRVTAGRRIQIPGPEDVFQIRVDGTRPVERIIAIAAAAESDILSPSDFRKVSQSGLSIYRGAARQFLEDLDRGISRLPRRARWGTAEAVIRVASAGRAPVESDIEDVIVEMRVARRESAGQVIRKSADMRAGGFEIDRDYEPISLRAVDPVLSKSLESTQEDLVIVRGRVVWARKRELESEPGVVGVWRDTPIATFQQRRCPIPPCDCVVQPKGTIDQVAEFLGVKRIWQAGVRGKGTAVGVVDTGITAEGRYTGTDPKVGRVTDGWPSDWGTKGGGHGNMCATDVLGMAPEAEVYDMRYSGRNIKEVISNAIEAYDWALKQFKATGKPQILSNSWGIFEESWDPDYAKNPKHPFIAKMLELMDAGILIVFSAGNCGETCPDTRCKKDRGPGRSIWGANGHPRVISVGAVNLRNEWIGYSSQGPASLDSRKPDICAVSHFKGYYPLSRGGSACDGGTSAACPIVAGVVALLKQANPQLKQDELRKLLCDTARDIGPVGWDQHSGHGILQAYHAFQRTRASAGDKEDGDRESGGWYRDD